MGTISTTQTHDSPKSNLTTYTLIHLPPHCSLGFSFAISIKRYRRHQRVLKNKHFSIKIHYFKKYYIYLEPGTTQIPKTYQKPSKISYRKRSTRTAPHFTFIYPHMRNITCDATIYIKKRLVQIKYNLSKTPNFTYNIKTTEQNLPVYS